MHTEENGPPSKEDKTAGILYMERLFVGNLDNEAQASAEFTEKLHIVRMVDLKITESMLNQLFSQYGHCESKIIRERNGTSKGYGFVTFNDAKIVQYLVELRTIKLQNWTLNLGLAIRKIKHPEQMNQMQFPVPLNHFNNGYMPPALQYFPNSTLALANPGNLLGNHGNGPPLLSAPTTHLPTWPYVPHFL